jgi:hypothetical protein
MKNFLLGSAVLLLTMQGNALAASFELASVPTCKQGEPICLESVIQEMNTTYEPLALQGIAMVYLRLSR